MRHLIKGVEPSLDRLGLSLAATVDLVRDAVGDALLGRRLDVNALGAEAADWIRPRLASTSRDAWDQEGPHAPGQSVGEAVTHFCLRILTLQRLICFAPRVSNTAPFVLVSEWLGAEPPTADPSAAPSELVRRYLRCYGPSTHQHFAAWLGVRPSDAKQWWVEVEDELTPVEFGRRAWILAEDLDLLRQPPRPRSIRLLPARAAYTQQRDRETILDKSRHREVWRPVGEPGSVVVDGVIVGTWRPRKTERRLELRVTPFEALPARHLAGIEDEAARMAALRGVTSVDVVIDE